MIRLAVINQKGGVGKTAIAYNLAWAFSQHAKTLLIDFDSSGNATSGLALGQHNTIYNSGSFLLKGFDPYHFDKVNKDLYAIPANISLALVAREIGTKSFRETILHRRLQAVDDFAKYCFIDCSPTLTDLTTNAIYAADFLLIPVTYEEDALEGMADLFAVINEIKEGQNFQYKIVMNKFDSRKSKTNFYIHNKMLKFIENGDVLKTIIKQEEMINQAKIEQKTIFEFCKTNKKYTRALTAFNDLTLEIMKYV